MKVGPPSPAQEDGKADGAASGKAELQITIDPIHIARARSRIGMLNAESQTRRISFYDTPALQLNEAGVVLRAREVDGDEDDTTIKMRPFTLAQLAPEFKANDDMKCELDQYPGKSSSACSLKEDVDEGAIAGVGNGEHQIRTLFDSGQEAFLATHGPGTVSWYDVVAYGPIDARVWEVETDEVREKVTAELWYMPDGTQALELSIKVKEAEADDAMDELLEFASVRELSLSTDTQSRTRRVLEVFSPAVTQQ